MEAAAELWFAPLAKARGTTHEWPGGWCS